MQARILEQLKTVNHIVPASRSAGTVEATGIDTRGYDEAAFTVNAGDIDDTSTDTTLAVHVEESDDNQNWADITGAAITTLTHTDDDAQPSINVRLSGRANRKRYLRAVAVVAGSSTAVYGVTCLLKGSAQRVTQSPAAVFV